MNFKGLDIYFLMNGSNVGKLEDKGSNLICRIMIIKYQSNGA